MLQTSHLDPQPRIGRERTTQRFSLTSKGPVSQLLRPAPGRGDPQTSETWKTTVLRTPRPQPNWGAAFRGHTRRRAPAPAAAQTRRRCRTSGRRPTCLRGAPAPTATGAKPAGEAGGSPGSRGRGSGRGAFAPLCFPGLCRCRPGAAPCPPSRGSLQPSVPWGCCSPFRAGHRAQAAA